ncbi:MAG: hypothetical protein IT258_07845 [Saprospiraceae bacterium]|nr:hypothetical protein [Saprospiraceae bacterium]
MGKLFHSVMTTDRTKFIFQLFKWLRSIEYIWLKSVLTKPSDTPLSSDIDLLVREKDLPALIDFVAQQPLVVACNMKRINEAVYLNLDFHDGSKLKIDLITALVRKQYRYLGNSYMIQNRVWKNDVASSNSKTLLEHALLYNYLNFAGLPEKYLRHFGAMPDNEQSALLMLINGKYGTNFQSLQHMATYSPAARQAIVEHLSLHPENSQKNRTKRTIHFIINTLRSRIRKQGQLNLPRTITFTGVDGAGKTTLLNDLKQVLSEKLQKPVVVLRHRPSLLPILSAYKHGKQAAEAKSAATLPRQGSNSSSFSSLLRFGYYFSDYLLGQIWVWLRYTLPGTTVIYDRYYFDFIVDAKRSNISLSGDLPKRLYRFIAKPDLNIFLFADPDTIRQRKQELSKAEIQLMTSQYQALFMELEEQYNGRYICIENHDRTNTLSTIISHYFNAQKPVNEPISATPAIANRKSSFVNPPIAC